MIRRFNRGLSAFALALTLSMVLGAPEPHPTPPQTMRRIPFHS